MMTPLLTVSSPEYAERLQEDTTGQITIAKTPQAKREVSAEGHFGSYSQP
ncbi:MAG TPA: hypothetical protein VJR02_17965 [Pyrinomonadaceae bacterium]|nr:hypothetical protein [Pyrinomonadaceae bacterium]